MIDTNLGQRRNTTIIALNSVSGLAQLAQFGMLYPLIGLWLNKLGMSTTWIGLVVSAAWVGMLLGNMYVPLILKKLGATTATASGLVLTATIALIMPHIDGKNLILWLASASLFGMCIGMRWIAVESWLFGIVDGEQKGKLVSIHETVIYLAQALGPLLIAYAALTSNRAFYYSAGLALCAMLPLTLARTKLPQPAHHGTKSPTSMLRGLFQSRQVNIKIGLLAGVLDGMLFGMISIYLIHQGFAEEQSATMLAVFGLGGLISQLPLGWLSDRYGVHKATQGTAMIGLIGVVLLLGHYTWLIWLGVGILGILAACALTLSIIATTEHSAKNSSDIVIAIAQVSIAFTLGSIVGPVLAGAVMDSVGTMTLPALTAIACVWLYRIAP
jgi:MFS family permease